MSSTNRGAERVALDAYYTPDPVARACLATIKADLSSDLGPRRRVWEPSAGGGAFVRATEALGCEVFASDIQSLPGVDVRNMLDGWEEGWGERPHWIVGNPPFNEAEDHVRIALSTARVGVGMLLRLAFLEGARRRAFWATWPAAEVHVFTSRPSFTGGATDSCAYGWFVWRHAHKGPTTLYHLEWK